MMKSKRPAYQEGIEVTRFDNRVRSDHGFHFKSYDPEHGVLAVVAREEEVKCDRTAIGLYAELAVHAAAPNTFPGLRRIVIYFYPAPQTHVWDYRQLQETER